MTLHDHAMSWSEDLIPNSVPEGNDRNGVVIVAGSDVLFTVDGGGHEGILVKRDGEDVRSFLQYVGDVSQGASNLGTDGVDLVWTHGEGRAPGDVVYPTRSVMTAPFTTDPEALEPRRLRSDLGVTMGTAERAFAVGCGHAARGDSGATWLTRLSDGVGWTFAKGATWQWTRPIGITCEHVYFYAFDGRPFIARVRLDTLGEGLPPD